MQLFNKTERELRKLDDVKIARMFVCSSFVYGADSRQREKNPDFHPPIGQTEQGVYMTADGSQIEEADVPQYILDCGPPPPVTPMGEREDLMLEDYMRDSFGVKGGGTVYQQPNGTFTADLQGRIRLKVVDQRAEVKPVPAAIKRGRGRPRKAA